MSADLQILLGIYRERTDALTTHNILLAARLEAATYENEALRLALEKSQERVPRSAGAARLSVV
jgi:hypothetical protein